jgi:hypothetical protein
MKYLINKWFYDKNDKIYTKIVKQVGKICLSEVYLESKLNPISGYEVVRLSNNNYPDSEDFGINGWSWCSLEQANNCYNQLV